MRAIFVRNNYVYTYTDIVLKLALNTLCIV